MLRILPLALLLTGGALAQSDDCGNATQIAGYGTYSFNTSSASDSSYSPCAGMGRDVFWAWTAQATANVTLSTCGASFDTVLAVYNGGGCPTGGAISCNDDSCNLQSSVSISAVAGQTYLVQVGSWNGNSSGSGSLDISAGGSGGSGGCTNPATGADVIVGDLNGITKYNANNGVSAYAIGTTSCNVGDAELLWIASTNQHPVIGQNIYRYEDGRFEQMGLSWLKHGFTALQQGLCCTCQSSGTGSRLGIGCSDPYGSSLNGSQSGLGPRFEVNPSTGAFNYPFTAQGQSGNSIYKRIQVANADVNPATHPNAVFYGEGHYIAPDDSASGNQANNASYRRINVGSGNLSSGWNMNWNGATVREEPAIRAWATHDPSVITTDVMVPNDGLLILASNATDNGDGTWHYEYAVHNLYSDRSCGAFSVPVPAGANVTNVGFHDVPYHSGEPYSSTDWTPSVSSGMVSWSTQTFSQNANANAIRWGTLYNFRFDCDVAPVNNGSATLGLFKPGNAPSVAGAAWVPDPNGGGGGIGTPYCSASANSTGATGVITASGSASVTANNLTLTASSLPASQFGMFIVSADQGSATVSAGVLCLSGQIGRFSAPGQIQNSGPMGTFDLGIDLSANWPVVGVQSVNPGETWHFSTWYRDQGQVSNFTNGLSILFQ